MNSIDHGNKTVKGQIEYVIKSVTKNGNDMFTAAVWSTDNEIYHCKCFGDVAIAYAGYWKEGQMVIVSGKHQTTTFNEDQREEIVFCNIVPWEPSWQTSAEIMATLANYCTKLLDSEIAMSENESLDAESKLKLTALNDSYKRHFTALQLINGECRILEEYKGPSPTLTLVYDGRDNYV